MAWEHFKTWQHNNEHETLSGSFRHPTKDLKIKSGVGWVCQDREPKASLAMEEWQARAVEQWRWAVMHWRIWAMDYWHWLGPWIDRFKHDREYRIYKNSLCSHNMGLGWAKNWKSLNTVSLSFAGDALGLADSLLCVICLAGGISLHSPSLVSPHCTRTRSFLPIPLKKFKGAAMTQEGFGMAAVIFAVGLVDMM